MYFLMCVMVKSCQVRRLKTLQRRYKSLPLDASGNPTTRGMPYLSGNVSLMRRGMETMEELDHFKFHLKLYLLFQCGFLTMTRLIWLHKLHSMIVTQHAVKKPEGDRMPSNAKFRSVGLMIIVVCPIRSFLLRSRKGQNALKLNEFVHIPQYAKLFMNDVELEFLAQDECKVFFKQKGDAAGRCAYHLVCRRHPW